MIRGPYACQLLGQACPCPQCVRVAPWSCSTRVPNRGVWVKPWSRPSPPPAWYFSPPCGRGRATTCGPGGVDIEGQARRRPAGAAALCAAPLISAQTATAVQEAGKADARCVKCGVLPSVRLPPEPGALVSLQPSGGHSGAWRAWDRAGPCGWAADGGWAAMILLATECGQRAQRALMM